MSTPNNVLMKEIYEILPEKKAKAMPALRIASHLNVDFQTVKGALRSLCFRNVVAKNPRNVVAARLRHGVTRHAVVKEQHYWRTG